ncbi:MAG: beta-ketoacyl-[acyl-carrier-protein] synthase family protein [Gammaproteobacteria bacterium]|nr:MAG: beta-ketoacyl-[acyl-carrier-protein] synthase family protein [Gammaproteobacteria bacterium]
MTWVNIAGMGAVCCYGNNNKGLVRALKENRPGIQPLTHLTLPFDNVPPLNPTDITPYGEGGKAMDAMMLDACHQALHNASYDTVPEGTALIIGTSNFMFFGEAVNRYDYRRDPNSAMLAPNSSGDVTQHLAKAMGITGPAYTIHTACSSSANALIRAREMIMRDEAEHILVLGAEGFSTIALSGFHSMMLMDPNGCRPFDVNRNGLQLGEAFAAVLLEKHVSKQAHGFYLNGGANQCDIHHVTSASPDGKAMHTVTLKALHDAGVSTQDITAIKAHGTGSIDNDTAEAAALNILFNRNLPPVTVLKRYLGHTLGACGTLETTALLGCIKEGFLPATLGFQDIDPGLNVTPITENVATGGGNYLLTFFGFGGNYAALVVGCD